MGRHKKIIPFEEGDLVQLKSDAFLSKKPLPMTVESIDEEVLITCVYRCPKGEILRKTFKNKSLMYYEKNDELNEDDD
jgi:hypothetical protein